MDNINFFVDRLKSVGDEALKEAMYLNLTVDDVLLAYDIAEVQSPILLKKNTWSSRIYPTGWGNGYVKIIPTHKDYGKHYDDFNVAVHGGLTFSEIIPNDDDSWPEGHWVGFDTAHSGDNPTVWPKSNVLDETKDLFSQIYNIKR